MNPDVVIVGAGPVGLFTAIEMKLLNPNLKIKIVERNEHYSRHHILRLDKSSLDQSKAYESYPEVRALNGFVPTSEIENTFLKIATAKELGVEIERGVKVNDCIKFLEQYPEAHSIIGADGAHSKVRVQLFGNEKIVDTELQYIVEIKYKVKGKTSKLPVITYGPAIGQVNHLISENVGKEKGGTTPVSLFIFVSEKTYKEIRGLHNAKLSDLKPETYRKKQLLNSIQPWLSLRKVALNEDMVKDSESINGVALNVYQSKLFAKQIGGKCAYLVGDAGAAVPYFRALNAGLIAARKTAQEIATQSSSDRLDENLMKLHLERLNADLSKLTQGEISRAHQQNRTVIVGRELNRVLSNASKLTTGALLTEKQQSAMLNARVSRPNFLRRHPRFLTAMGAFLLLSVILLALFTPFLTILPAILFSVSSAALIVLTAAFIVKSVAIIKEIIRNKNNPIEPQATFPWEIEDSKENDNSFASSKGLNDIPQNKESRIPIDVTHVSNPLRPSSSTFFHAPTSVLDEADFTHLDSNGILVP